MGLNSAYGNFQKTQKSGVFQNEKMPNPNGELD